MKTRFLLYPNIILLIALICVSYLSFTILHERKIELSAANLLERINWLEQDHKNKTGKYFNDTDNLAHVFFIEASQPTPKNVFGLTEGAKYPYSVIVFSHPNTMIYRALIVAEGANDLDGDKYPEIWWISSKEQKARSLREFPKE